MMRACCVQRSESLQRLKPMQCLGSCMPRGDHPCTITTCLSIDHNMFMRAVLMKLSLSYRIRQAVLAKQLPIDEASGPMTSGAQTIIHGHISV